MVNDQASAETAAEAVALALVENGRIDLGPVSRGYHPGAQIRLALADIEALIVAYVEREAGTLAKLEDDFPAGPNGEGSASRNF